MQSPPPYSVSGRKKSNVGLIIGIVVVCLAFCCVIPTALLVKGGMDIFKNSTGMIGCAADMGATRDGLLAYAKKHKGMLPAATNWKKDIQPYLKDPVIPPPLKPAASLASGLCEPATPTSICYNSAVAGKKVSDLEDQEEAKVVLFEIPGNSPDAQKEYAALPLADSPKIIANQPRGWISIDITGDAYVVGRNGRHAPIGNVSQGGHANVKVGD